MNRRMYNLALDWLQTRHEIQELFPFGRGNARKIVKRWVKMNAHWFRHTRITHLVSSLGLRETEVASITGHSDTRPLKRYYEGQVEDYAHKT